MDLWSTDLDFDDPWTDKCRWRACYLLNENTWIKWFPDYQFDARDIYNRDDWQRAIKVLVQIRSVKIEVLNLRLPDPRASGDGDGDGDSGELGMEFRKWLDELRIVLGTGQFSSLKTLRLSMPTDVTSGLGLADSASLAAALRNGQFTNLHSLSLPACDVSEILAAMIDEHISQLRSFSIGNDTAGLGKPSRRNLSEKMDVFLKHGYFKNLQHLSLRNGVLDGTNDWEVFIEGVRSGKMPNITSLCLSENALNLIDLADLVPLLLWNSLENLVMDNCWINSEQVCGLVDAIMSGHTVALALKRLDLRDNLLGNKAVAALVKLAESDRLLQLQELDLNGNMGMDWTALMSLTETIKLGHLPALENLKTSTPANDAAVEGIVEAYSANEDLTMTFDIKWSEVSDVSLQTKVREYRDRNLRLKALKEEHKEELKDVVPLNCAKVFLCGYPEVGKTTLRRTLKRSPGLKTRFTWETRPSHEPRTRGIELCRLEEKKNDKLALTFWDLAGQEEYHVLHGSFLTDLGFASGKATTFVLVFKAMFEIKAEAKLFYWLRFVASSSQKHVKRHVVIVLNCFDGKQCAKQDNNLWMALIGKYESIFRDLLYIHRDPFTIDVRVADSVKPLKDHLFNNARTMLLNVKVPRVCLELQEELKRWPESKQLPILSWQAFEEQLNLTSKTKHLSTKALKAATSYLHEIGGIIYFDEKKLSEPGSRNRSIVVPNPEWFCRQVVGELLLPKEMLEGGCSTVVGGDGSITRVYFEAFFRDLLIEGIQSDDVLLMLERVGLCFRKGEGKIIVPALVGQDDYSSMEWEGQGFHGVMGRCLAPEDHERSVIPVTLFRRLQVELAQDFNFGGCGDSEYRAGKSFSSFKVGELLVLIQFDVDHANPIDDRIDILVKNVIQGDPKEVALGQVTCIHEIMKKLESLCFACCPGLRYDVKVIRPWSASAKTPNMTERELMSLREIKLLLMTGQRKNSSWQLNGNAVELKTFLTDSELRAILEIRSEIDEVPGGQGVPEEPFDQNPEPDFWSEESDDAEDVDVAGNVTAVMTAPDVLVPAIETSLESDVLFEEIAEKKYHDCKQDAVILGLLTEASLQTLEDADEETSSNGCGLALERSPFEYPKKDVSTILYAIHAGIHDVKLAVRGEAHRTRQHVSKRSEELLSEIQHKHSVLLKHIQSQQAFSIEERGRSVPMYIFLSKKRGQSRVWISLTEAVQSTFHLHFLCEAHFDHGLLHEVAGQEGIKLKKTKDWLVKVSPWLRRSLQVAVMVGKTVGNVYLPGVFNLIPDINLANEGRAQAKAVDRAATILLEENEGVNQIQNGPGDCGSSAEPVKLKERLIAQAVVKDLISEVRHVEFVKKIRLRKVLLRTAVQPEAGTSSQQTEASVLWICDDCYKRYGERATDV